MVSCYRPSSGMRCDTRLLSSFITGALTATTVTIFLLRVVPWTYVVLPCDPTITARPVQLDDYLDRLDQAQSKQLAQEEAVIQVEHQPFYKSDSARNGIMKKHEYPERLIDNKQKQKSSKEKDYNMSIMKKDKRKPKLKYYTTTNKKTRVKDYEMT